MHHLEDQLARYIHEDLLGQSFLVALYIHEVP
jgi:hypothetical protein